MNYHELRRRFPNASESFLLANTDVPTHCEIASPKPERATRDDALAEAQAQGRNQQRFLVVITSFRRRLLDEDNLCGKYHCDLLRYAGILPSDAPGQTQIQNRQSKVKTKEEERTEIEVTIFNPNQTTT